MVVEGEYIPPPGKVRWAGRDRSLTTLGIGRETDPWHETYVASVVLPMYGGGMADAPTKNVTPKR